MNEQVEAAPQEAAQEAVSAADAVQTETPSPEAADGAETPEAAPVDGEQSPEDGPKKSRNQRRKEQMQRLYEEREDLQSKLDAAQAELEQRREAAQQGQPPKEADFGTYEEYLAARSAWQAVRAIDDRQVADQTRALEQQQATIQARQQAHQELVRQNWTEQVADAKTRYADFEAVAYTAPIPESAAPIIAEMDRGADVAYHLGLNPQKAQALARMSPTRQAMELARLEMSLAAPQPRTATQAPDPVTPVKPKAAASTDPAKMSMAEYMAARKSGKIR